MTTSKAMGNVFKLRDIVDIKDPLFGAKGDGTTDDSTAVYDAITATPAGGELWIRAGTFIIDREYYLTSAITLRGPGTLKLKDNSSVFNDSANPYTRYLFHVRASEVRFIGVKLDGNSNNNSYTPAGTTYYQYNSGGQVRQVGLILVGFYNTPATGDLQDIVFQGNTIHNSPHTGLDTNMQGNAYSTPNSNYYIRGLRVIGNHFKWCQGVQLVFSDCLGAVATGNTHIDPYFAHFQWYYRSNNCRYSGNVVDYQTGRINLANVDPLNKTGAVMNFCGYAKLGKLSTEPNNNCQYRENTLRGGHVYLTEGNISCSVAGNTIDSSEQVGIEINGFAVTDIANAVVGNKITKADQPAIYVDNINATAEVFITDNEMEGNCTNILVSTYGSRALNSQVYIFDGSIQFHRNYARKGASTVDYGITFDTAAQYGVAKCSGNDFYNSGDVNDCVINTAAYPPVIATILLNPNTTPNFLAYKSATATNVTGNNALYTVVCNTEIYDAGGNYDTGSGTFTAPVSGRYRLSGAVYMSDMSAAAYRALVQIVTSNRTFSTAYPLNLPAANLEGIFECNIIADMEAGDTALLKITVSGMAGDTADVTGDAVASTRFAGSLIRD